MKMLQRSSHIFLIVALVICQCLGKKTKESVKPKPDVVDDRLNEEKLITSEDEDAKIKKLVEGIHEVKSLIENVSIDKIPGLNGHKSGFEKGLEGLENEIVMIQKAKLDMELVKLGDELKETLRKRDLKKELENVMARIATTYLV